MTIRYIADLHFDHADIIPYDNRPFAGTEDMNRTLTENWNRVVGPDDLTWIIGDFCGGSAARWQEILGSLNGRKALICGNHDPEESVKATRGLFEEVAEYREITDGDRHVVLCHYPLMAFRNQYFGWYHLYGHVHASYEWNITENAKRLMRSLYVRNDIMRMANAGAMMPYMDYTPMTLDELLPQL